MKSSARLLLIVALLLPFRGALAVSGWLCQTEMPMTASMAAQSHEPANAPMAGTNPDADHGGCHGAGDESGQASTDKPACNLCSSICGAPAFPSGDAQLRALPPQGAERFASIAPPHAEFALGGLERPPRSL